MKTIWTNTLALLVVLVAIVGFTASASAQDDRPAVPNFELSTVTGDRVELSDFAGSVVVINFWATWCGPCQQELPHLQRLSDTYADQGLVVLTIATDGPDTFSRVRSLVRRARWTMHVLLDQDGAVTSLLNPAEVGAHRDDDHVDAVLAQCQRRRVLRAGGKARLRM